MGRDASVKSIVVDVSAGVVGTLALAVTLVVPAMAQPEKDYARSTRHELCTS